MLRLEKTSLREQALTALRRAITTGQLTPGTHLVETDLSEALQISRGTLREAMRQLQQEGLISAGARGRLSVRHLDAKEIKNIFDVRAALESLAASTLAARQDRAEAVTALRDAVADMERWAASNLEDRIEADLKFHRTMCLLTGNETLLHQWSSLEGSIRMSIMFAGVDRALKNMDAKRHYDIVDAIESGERDTAAAAVREPHGGRRSRFGRWSRLTRHDVSRDVVRLRARTRPVPWLSAVVAAWRRARRSHGRGLPRPAGDGLRDGSGSAARRRPVGGACFRWPSMRYLAPRGNCPSVLSRRPH